MAGVVTVIHEVEYLTDSEEVARRLAARDAKHLFQQEDVLAVTVDLKRPRASELPITERYLQDEPVEGLVERVEEYAPHQMDVDECIEQALSEDA